MSTSRVLKWAVGAAVLVGAVAGCTPVTADPGSRPSGTPTTAASASATATAEPTASEPMADWVVSFEGMGPLVRGADLDAAALVSGEFRLLTPAECPAEASQVFASLDGPTLWARVSEPGSRTLVSVAVGFDGNTRPQTLAASPKTAEGIGVGSSLDDLLRAYPAARLDPLSETVYYWIDGGPDEHIVFAIVDDLVNAISVQPDTQYMYDFCG